MQTIPNIARKAERQTAKDRFLPFSVRVNEDLNLPTDFISRADMESLTTIVKSHHRAYSHLGPTLIFKIAVVKTLINL